MRKGERICDQCKGARLVPTITGRSPCFGCNGAGVVKANGKAFREWEVIYFLLLENAELEKKNYLLKNMPTASAEQHDGVGKGRYRGD